MDYPNSFNEKIEKMTKDEITELQNVKLKKQMAYVYANSPFYQEKLKEAGLKPEQLKTVDDLVNFPFTTKYELRDSQVSYPPYGNHVCANEEKIIRVHASSGTTGAPSYIPITAHDRDVWTEVVSRCYYAEGVRPNSKVVMGFGIGFFVGGLPLHDAIENIGATFIPIGTGNSDRIVSSFVNLKADMLTCTPSYAIYLAEWIRNKLSMDPRELGVKRILCGAEPGGGVPGVRKKIEDDWGAIVSESLGNADILPVYCAECEERTGNHFLGHDMIYLEIIDPETGQRLKMEDGASGELVATHLDRDTVPIIRFRTRDRIEVYDDPCACGRKTFRVRCVGRTDDMLIVLGVNVFPSAIKDVVSEFRPKTTGEIQILLEKPGPKVDPPLKIQVEYAAGVEDLATLKKQIEGELRSKLIFQPQVELVPEGILPRFEMKAQLIKKLYEETA
ncbi:MAG: phenylacetate--CoA ligase family protein [Bacillota bacterium]|nr:phenylacetate--CoA ligase family protein [Bacillota bacterium]